MTLETVQDLRARHERETVEVRAKHFPAEWDSILKRTATRQAAELLACAQGWEARAKELERDAGRLDKVQDMRATVYHSSNGARHWVVVDETAKTRKGSVAPTLREAIDAAKDQS